MYNDVQLLARALGMNGIGRASKRNHFLAPAGTEHHESCLKLTQDGFMVQKGNGGNFQVTPLGITYVKSRLLNDALDDLIAERVSSEASITASERVSPNAFEYEGLCESLEEDPGVNQRAIKDLCRDLLKATGELMQALGDATHTAAYWAPDDFDNDEHRENFQSALAWHQSCLKRSRQLVGDASRFVLRDVQEAPTIAASIGAPCTEVPSGERTFYAVFEVLPANTPVQWVQDGIVYVKNTEEHAAISMIAGVELPDQSIAVLRTKMGEALSAQAHERAAQFPNGRVVEVKSLSWPRVRDCFQAILAESDIDAQFDLLTETPVG